MANFFDQFDTKPSPAASSPSPAPASAGNFFDQFDAPTDTSTATAPASAAAPQASPNIVDSAIKTIKAVPSQIVPGVAKAIPHAVESTVDLAAAPILPTELGRGDENPSFAEDRALNQFMTQKYGPADPNKPNGWDEGVRRQGYQDFIAQGGQSSMNVPAQPTFGQRISQGLSAAHINPDDYFQAPATPEERAAEAGVEGAALMLTPGGRKEGWARIAKMAADIGTGFAGGVAGEAAYEAAPDEYKVPASLAAGLVGGVGAAGVSKVLGSGARRAGDYLAPAFGNPAKIAAKRLASVVTDRDAALSGLANPEELVPGSSPTAFQATGDVGLGSMERAMERSDVPFKDDLLGRLGEQNAARLGALENLQDSGHPAAVADYFRTRMQQLEGRADQLYTVAQNDAQKAAGDLGVPSATQTGETARSAVLANLKGLNDEANHLWGSIDPDGKLSVLTNPLVRSTARIYGGMSPEQMLSLSPAEKSLAGIIGSYPETIPFSRFKDLRSEISRAMREARSYQSPNDMAYGRLAQLRGAVEEAVSDSIAGKVSAEQQAVRTGQMSEEDTLAANFLKQAREWYANREAAAGTGAAPRNGVPEAGGPSAVPRAAGAEGAPRGGPTGTPGLEGLPRNADIPDRGDVGDEYGQHNAPVGAGAGEPGVRPVSGEAAPRNWREGREPDGSLVGLPRRVGTYTASTHVPAQAVAQRYMKRSGLPYRPPRTYAKVDPERAGRIAAAYDAMKHDPQNPQVKASYDAMASETLAQYRAMLADGMKIEFIPEGAADPYAGNPRNMTEDVRKNKHMWVFPTKSGFGSDATFDVRDNPLLADSGFKISGQPATVNDVFRAVHDYFGHVKEGVGFRADGEENAWRSHSAMYSPLARKAMTTETRGQNSWVNYGPYGETNRTARSENTHYADQKIGILPDWAVNEGAGDEKAVAQTIADRFVAAGRPPEEAKALGAITDAFYKTMGIDPNNLPKVRAGEDDVGGQSLGQSEYRPTFYSAVHRAVEANKTNKANADQWIATLKNTPGIKQEEMDWLGVEPWLRSQQRTVTKQELSDYIRDNQMEIEETHLAGGGDGPEVTIGNWEREEPDPEWMRESATDDPNGYYMKAARQRISDERDIPDHDASEPFDDPELESEAKDSATEHRTRDYWNDDEEPDVANIDVDGRNFHARRSYDELEIYDPQEGKVVYQGSDHHMDDEAITNVVREYLINNGEYGGGSAEGADGPTQYHDYAERGGEDYHELLLKLPHRVESISIDRLDQYAINQSKYRDQWKDVEQRYADAIARLRAAQRESGPERDAYNAVMEERDALLQKMRQEREAAMPLWLKGQNYTRSHWGEPNVVAHVRFDTRNVNGKKTLFLQEIQSDWHQQGRDSGYAGPDLSAKREAAKAKLDAAEQAYREKLINHIKAHQPENSSLEEFLQHGEPNRYRLARHLQGRLSQAIADWKTDPNHPEYETGKLRASAEVEAQKAEEEAYQKLASSGAAEAAEVARREYGATDPHRVVPDAPFKTTWPELALKRMIRYAAENGYDQIAWTPGDLQNGGLVTKAVSHIDYVKMPDGTFNIETISPDGWVQGRFTGPLEGVAQEFGKDVADQMRSGGGKDISGMKKVAASGDEPMRSIKLPEVARVGGDIQYYYGKVIPNLVQKLTKKFGSTITRAPIELQGEKISSMVLPINEKMKAGALEEGFPLFQGRRGAINIGRNGQSVISLFKTADASTGLHELGHHFLDMYRAAAESGSLPKALQGDWNAVRDWWGQKAKAVARDGGKDVAESDVRAMLKNGTTGDTAKDNAIYVGMHEQWARAFESYLRDGRAPTEGLRGAFDRFKRWLTQVYHSITGLNVDVSPQMKGVFDRMLGGEGASPTVAKNATVASRQPVTEMAQEAPRLIDPAAAQRFKAATAATKNIKETFGTKPIKDIVHRPGATMPFTKTPEWVAGNIWRPGPEGSAIVQKVLKAAGNRAEARQAVNDAAVLSMRSAALKDGVVDPAKLEAWRAKHASALSQVPDLDRRLRSAAQASKAMVEAGQRRAAAREAAQQGAIGKIMQLDNDADVSNALGTMLGGKGSVQSMRDLVNQASGDPDALAGLRRGVVDHLFSRFRTPKDSISAHQFQQYVNRVSPALQEVLTPEQMGTLRNIAADLKRATKDVRASGGGSDTKENFANQHLVARPTRAGSLINHIISDVGVGTLAAAFIHPLSGIAWSAISGIGAGVGAHLLQSMREAGLGRVDDLLKEALLNPELAHTLLKSAPATNSLGWRRALMHALSKIALQQGVQAETRERQKNAA